MGNTEIGLMVIGMWVMWFMGFAAGRISKR